MRFAFCIGNVLLEISIAEKSMAGGNKIYHFFPEETETLQCTHSLGAGVGILENDMCLSPHLGCFQRNNVKDDAVGGKKHVKIALQVFFLELIWEVVAVETKNLIC